MHPARRLLPLSLVLLALLPCVIVSAATPPPTPKVYRARVEPVWITPDRFWYRNDLAGDAREFIVVDAATGVRAPAFDHARAAAALSLLTGQAIAADRLPAELLVFSTDGSSIALHGRDKAWRIDLKTYTASEVAQPAVGKSTDEPARPAREVLFINHTPNPLFLHQSESGKPLRASRELKPGARWKTSSGPRDLWLVQGIGDRPADVLRAPANSATVTLTADGCTLTPGINEPAPRTTVRSPDGRWEAFVRDHNLWVRVVSGKTGESAKAEPPVEFPLSFDGNPGNSFHEDSSRDRLVGMDYEKPDAPATRPDVTWSPDSTHLVAMQTKTVPERRVHLVESSPADQLQPKQHSYPYLKPGDDLPTARPRLFRVADRRELLIDDALFRNPWSIERLTWHPDSREFTFLFNQRGHQVLRLIAVDAATGAARTAIEETSPTFIHYSGQDFFLETLPDTQEALWTSERDGWNHLHLFDLATGRGKNQITRGEWVVRKVDRVDTKQRQLWFVAGGIVPGQDPYYTHLCRVNFDGTGLAVLTAGDGTHETRWSPTEAYFLDTWSRVDQPPVTELRRAADGALVCSLEKADASEVLAARPLPERFVAKGRDGTTDIYGIIMRPPGFDAAKKYPVIERIYAGPHGFFTPKAFGATDALLEKGFIVVQLDGMGTDGRSKKFHDVCFQNLRDAGFPDRRLWLTAAAAKYPSLDLTRLGIYGTSAGAQSALAALLWHGDFYKAAGSDCGCHDNRMDKIWWNEQWMGWPVGPAYAENSNVDHAHRLQGKLLLAVGELDRNVDPASTYQVVNALQKADKPFEFLVIPGGGHGAFRTPYGRKALEDFFVRTFKP